MELKWFDQGGVQGNLPFGLAQLVQPLALVAQGAGPTQRIGRTIVVKSMEMKIGLQGIWVPPPAGAQALGSISYRVDVLLDKQTNGAICTGADIYDTSVAGTDATNRFMNLYNENRFTLLKRWQGDLNPPSFAAGVTATALQQQVSAQRDLVLSKRCNIPVEYSGATGQLAEVRSNQIYVVYSQTQNGTAGQVLLQVNTADYRIRYYDS